MKLIVSRKQHSDVANKVGGTGALLISENLSFIFKVIGKEFSTDNTCTSLKAVIWDTIDSLRGPNQFQKRA